MISKVFSKIVSKPGGALIRISQWIYTPAKNAHQITLQKWFADEGDRNLRLQYNLSPNSVVFDLGGFEGQFASDIYAKYCCKVFVFELSKNYAANIKKRFAANPDIKVFEFGLAPEDSTSILYVNDERSSVFANTGTPEAVEFKAITTFMNELDIKNVDLIKLNIEGGEYDLLEYLLQNNTIQHFKNIQVQFHDLDTGSALRMKKIKDKLSHTHALTYEYPFVWENWQLK